MIYDVALTLLERIGPRTASALVETFGSAQIVMNAPKEQLTEVGVAESAAKIIDSQREQVIHRAHSIIEQCNRSGIAILAKNSEHYPNLLAQCEDAPHLIYVRGYVNFNAGKWISVVGTRKATQLGVSQTNTIVSDIAASYPDSVIVSGLAFGIDKAAHSAAIDNGIPTVAVMAGWVDDITPRAHYALARKIINGNGAIVSDMPPGTIIRGGNFLSRNRIIAGLSHATIVVESAAKGGSLVTADIALSYDRELFTLPGRSDDLERQGTNMLIKSNKASLYQDVSDLAQTMGWARATLKKHSTSALPEYLAEAFEALPDTEPFTLDYLSDALGIQISDASSRMIQLEIRGFVKSIQGRMYQKYKF